MIDYNNMYFRPVQNSDNGEITQDTIFHYKQNGNVLVSEYKGGNIVCGQLIGLVDKEGNIDMRYHQINTRDELMTGICHSKPEILADGRIRLYENWKWTSGDLSEGYSVLEEIE
jgi:hypothetical protein